MTQGIDSLDALTIFTQVEEKYGIHIPDDDFAQLDSVSDVGPVNTHFAERHECARRRSARTAAHTTSRRHTWAGREQLYVNEAFATNSVAPVGPHVDAFEQEFAAAVGARHAATVSMGTAALHLALILAGVGPGDEVLCSPR